MKWGICVWYSPTVNKQSNNKSRTNDKGNENLGERVVVGGKGEIGSEGMRVVFGPDT